VGLFYTMYRRNVNKGLVKGICEGSVYITQGTSKDYIGLRPKVYSSILGSLYNKAGNPNGDFNSISFINK